MSRKISWIIRDRGQGKTTALLDWLRAAPAGEHRVIVSHTRRASMQLLTDARAAAQRRGRPCELSSWQFVCFDEARSASGGFGVLLGRGDRIVLALDDVDLVLQGLTEWPIGAATATGEAVT